MPSVRAGVDRHGRVVRRDGGETFFVAADPGLKGFQQMMLSTG
jgi:hypothetical protein